jgi:hypothetical protein
MEAPAASKVGIKQDSSPLSDKFENLSKVSGDEAQS